MIVWEHTGVPPRVKWLISLDCASPPLGTTTFSEIMVGPSSSLYSFDVTH